MNSPLYISILLFLNFFPLLSYSQIAENITVVRPKEISDVLVNPGIGFTTFQRFNGDDLNPGRGWTEGFPIAYQEFDGSLENKDHPQTSIAYWRVYWRYLEPEQGNYRWDLIDQAIDSAMSRGQRMMLRVAPYGNGVVKEKDVPDWYRKIVGDNTDWEYNNPVNMWLVDPEDPRYVEHFGGLISEIGKHYDGHPGLEAVDLSIVGAWGEGAGSELLSERTYQGLINAYTDNFKRTPIIVLLMDEKTNGYARAQRDVGWRVDCIGDLGFWADEQNGWTHMYDFYPQSIINYGVSEDWRKSPVSLEICGTFLTWKEVHGYNEEQVKYIFDQTLKWHISSFNAKSSPVPPEWQPLVDEWLKKMGYRFVLRKFSYPSEVRGGDFLAFESWWENKGVAPCYTRYPLAVRLQNKNDSHVFLTVADIRTWLPGDVVFNDKIHLPKNIDSGKYRVQIALANNSSEMTVPVEGKIKLAIEGLTEDGWYDLGEIKIINE